MAMEIDLTCFLSALYLAVYLLNLNSTFKKVLLLQNSYNLLTQIKPYNAKIKEGRLTYYLWVVPCRWAREVIQMGPGH